MYYYHPEQLTLASGYRAERRRKGEIVELPAEDEHLSRERVRLRNEEAVHHPQVPRLVVVRPPRRQPRDGESNDVLLHFPFSRACWRIRRDGL